MLRWFDREKKNYRRRSARTDDLRNALAMAADLADALDSGEAAPDKVGFAQALRQTLAFQGLGSGSGSKMATIALDNCNHTI